jgi:hypothetical protein
MKTEYGEFLFRAVPLLIIFGVSVIFAIAARFINKKHYDGPDYRNE